MRTNDAVRSELSIPVPGADPISAMQYPALDPVGVVVLHPATATPQRFYASFANYLSSIGLTAITYDYRGTGRSGQPKQNRHIRMRDWLDVDIPAVTAWARDTYPDLPHLAVGHSLGGHGLSLGGGGNELAGFAMVASHAGVTDRIPDRMERLRVRLVLEVLAPTLGRLLGYIPGQRLGLGEDMPLAAMNEWRGWTRQPRYFFDDPTMDAAHRMSAVRTHVRAIGLSDDAWATPEQMHVFIEHLTNAQVEFAVHEPAEAGAETIGHHGYFRERVSAELWPALGDWLLERARVTP